jgi:hypothetical protein
MVSGVFFLGISMTSKSYSEKLLDPRWQKMRLEVLSRDGFQCVLCADNESTLHAHHVHYHPQSEGPWDYDPSTIITLCSSCHAEEHKHVNTSKANVILALAAKGYRTTYDFDCFANIISCLSIKELDRFFMENQNGKNQNS